MSVVSLDKFKDEILKLIADGKNEGVGVLNSKFLEADEKATEELKNFAKELLDKFNEMN